MNIPWDSLFHRKKWFFEKINFRKILAFIFWILFDRSWPWGSVVKRLVSCAVKMCCRCIHGQWICVVDADGMGSWCQFSWMNSRWELRQRRPKFHDFGLLYFSTAEPNTVPQGMRHRRRKKDIEAQDCLLWGPTGGLERRLPGACMRDGPARERQAQWRRGYSRPARTRESWDESRKQYDVLLSCRYEVLVWTLESIVGRSRACAISGDRMLSSTVWMFL
jgi:hypothetical protein